MGGSISGAATRGRRAATHTSIVAALAGLVLALSAGAAFARPAPDVVITSAPDAVTRAASAHFAFATAVATDDARFECRFDDQLVDCAANGAAGSYDAGGLAEGSHTFSVRATTATDPADDDWGPAAASSFRVERVAPAPADPVAPPPAGSGAPAGSAATAVPATPRVPRQEIGTACVEISAARARARFALAGRTAIVRFTAPAAARFATVTLRRASGGRRRGAVVATLAAPRLGRSGVTHTTRIALTRAQSRLVRAGTARPAIAYSTCRGQAGEWQWVAAGR